MDISLTIPECRVARFVEQHTDHLIIPVRLDAASGRCPDCGQASRSIHSRRHRRPADLPVSASQTRLRIEVRRFYCLNPTCRRRTFAEGPMTLLAPRARRTRRLGEAQARVGLACGGAQAARVSSRTSTCRQAARPCCGSSPASRCLTRRLPSGSASTTGQSGRAAATARLSSISIVAASSTSSLIARHPR